MKKLSFVLIIVLTLGWTDARASKVEIDGKTIVVEANGAKSEFTGAFRIFYLKKDPKKSIRRFLTSRSHYMAPTWFLPSTEVLDDQIEYDQTKGGDGWDMSLEGSMENRTYDVFAAAPYIDVEPTKIHRKGKNIYFEYAPTELGTLEVTLDTKNEISPKMSYTFTPSKKGFFSVAYIGAKAYKESSVTECWQPLAWMRGDVPDQSYLSMAFQCPIPTSFVLADGVITGVIATKEQIPFDPLPTRYNNRFGVALRNQEGDLQPMIFSPVLGHMGSEMKPGDKWNFSFTLYVDNKTITDAYEYLSIEMFEFKDYRNNAVGTLNNTVDNMVEYTLSKYTNFVDSLKGLNYSTDVPGSVKNVSSLYPLCLSVITDDPNLYAKRGYPIMEYMLSRDGYCFCLDTTQKVQNPTRNLGKGCAPASELILLYKLSGSKSGVLKKLAEEKYEQIPQTSEESWVMALEFYRATGDKAYLDKALSGGERYLSKIAEMTDTRERKAGFWSEVVPFYINLLEMYEHTKDKRYLEASRLAAMYYAMCSWMVPVIPDSLITVNKGGLAPHYWYLRRPGWPQMKMPEETVPAWRLSEIGLTSESTCTSIGHRAVFMSFHAAPMMRLANYTGDKFLHDISRSSVIGRFANFPGYHMNTERTTAYEKADYPLRKYEELTVNSFHFAHIMPLTTELYDYMVNEVMYKSKNAIDFDGEYIHGYAYMQSKFYGTKPGKFYDIDNAWLWMPRRMLTTSNQQLNYLSARGDNMLMLAFTNQSKEDVKSTITFNPSVLSMIKGKTYQVEVWEDNKKVRDSKLVNGKIDLAVSAEGITAIAIKGIAVKTKFQHKFESTGNEAWKNDYKETKVGRAKAMMLNMGIDLKSVYVFLQDDDSKYRSAKVYYKTDTSSEFKELEDKDYPFEFTIPLTNKDRKVEMKLEGKRLDGKVETESFFLSK